MAEMARGRNGGAQIAEEYVQRIEKLDEWQREHGLKMMYAPAEDTTLFMMGDRIVARVEHNTLWPSQHTIAQIALAVMAGQGEKKDEGTS